MINKIILTVTMVNLVNATVLTVKNNDDNYWKMSALIPLYHFLIKWHIINWALYLHLHYL